MNHFEKLIAKTGDSIKLSDTERAQMRMQLSEYMAWKPLPARTKPVASPFNTFIIFLAQPARTVMAALLVIVLGGGGAAFAAENALPGDALYPIKTDVTEPIRTALAPTPEAKAEWQMTVATRRIDEAAALANEGKLSSSTEAALAVNFTQNADAASATIDASPTVSLDTRDISATSFSTKLAAYETILTQLDQKEGTGSTVALRKAIRAQIRTVAIADTEMAPLSASASVSSTATPSTAVPAETPTPAPSMMTMGVTAEITVGTTSGAAEPPAPETPTMHPTTMAPMRAAVTLKAVPKDVGPIQMAAITALQTSKDVLDSASSSLSASTSVDAQAAYDDAASYAAQGQALLDEDDTDGAYNAYQSSLSASSRLQVYTHMAAFLKINPFATTTATSTQPQFIKGNRPYLRSTEDQGQ